MPTRRGGIRIFRIAGIDVYLHWLWFVVGIYEITSTGERYSSLAWNAAEYVTLFLLVLLHEFGHALACRSVGGRADHIVLWPLGGVAYVAPPPRAGATLWTSVAGPLVNVAFLPILVGAWWLGKGTGLQESQPDLQHYLSALAIINAVMLIFNLLPIFPLDGGQILRALLWFMIGRVNSLGVVSVLGFVGVGGVALLALALQDVFLGIIAGFILLNCVGGLNHARLLARAAKAPHRDGFACPSCGTAPPVGAFWVCPRCRKMFDTFEAQAFCPGCSTAFPATACFECGGMYPMGQWITPGATSTFSGDPALN